MLKFGFGLLASIWIAVIIGCGAVHSATQLGEQAKVLIGVAHEQSASHLAPAIFQKARENLAKGDTALNEKKYDQAKHWYKRAIIDAELTLTQLRHRR